MDLLFDTAGDGAIRMRIVHAEYILVLDRFIDVSQGGLVGLDDQHRTDLTSSLPGHKPCFLKQPDDTPDNDRIGSKTLGDQLGNAALPVLDCQEGQDVDRGRESRASGHELSATVSDTIVNIRTLGASAIDKDAFSILWKTSRSAGMIAVAMLYTDVSRSVAISAAELSTHQLASHLSGIICFTLSNRKTA